MLTVNLDRSYISNEMIQYYIIQISRLVQQHLFVVRQASTICQVPYELTDIVAPHLKHSSRCFYVDESLSG